MKKRKIFSMLLGAAVLMGVLAGCGAASSSNDNDASSSTAETVQTSSAEETTSSEDGKTLVVYFSAQGHTVNFAEAIAEELDADIFEITPVDEYTSDDLNWNDEDSRVTREHEDESLRDIPLTTTQVENWDSYDTVYIGYPIWWGLRHGR